MKELARYFEKEDPDFPPNLMSPEARAIHDSIYAIESSKQTPTFFIFI
jgi:hypothetical protein